MSLFSLVYVFIVSGISLSGTFNRGISLSWEELIAEKDTKRNSDRRAKKIQGFLVHTLLICLISGGASDGSVNK